MKKRQLILVFFLTSVTLTALNYDSVVTKSATTGYQQSALVASSNYVTAQSVSFKAPVETGNLIVVAVSTYSDTTANISGVTDNYGNTYNKAVTNPLTPKGQHFIGIWYAQNSVGGTNFTVTATSAAQLAYITVAAHEYYGMVTAGALDQVQGASGTGTSASAGQTGDTSQSQELVFGAFLHQDAGIVNYSGGPNFTAREAEVNGAVEPLITQDQFVQAQGRFEAPITFSSSTNWNGVVAAFKVRNESLSPTTATTPTVSATTVPQSTAVPTTAVIPTTAAPPSPPATPTAEAQAAIEAVTTLAPTATALPPTATAVATATPTAIPTSQPLPGAYSYNSFPVGPGGSDNIPHQLIRTKDDRVYIFGYQGQRSANIKAYWTTTPGLPTSVTVWSSTQTSESELALSVDPVYDGDATIHVFVNTDKGNLKDYVFDTASNSFKPPYLIATGNPTVAGDYVGTSGLSAMLDTNKILHVAYWSTENHIAYRSLSYAPESGTFTPVNGPTQLDTAGSGNHPALAVSPVDNSVTVAWVSEAGNSPQILARTAFNGQWGNVETVGSAKPWTSTSAGINIDQGPSLVVDRNGKKHLAYIEDFDATGDYGHTHYVLNQGNGWVDKTLPSYTHDPALVVNGFGDVFVFGHGHANNAACKSNLDMCVTKQNDDGSWPSPTLFASHPANGHFDSSPSVKYSVVGYNRPETVEVIFPLIIGDYSNSTFIYGSITSSSVAASTAAPTSTPTPAATPTVAPSPTPADTPAPTPTAAPASPTTSPGQGSEQTFSVQVNNGNDEANEDGGYFTTDSGALWIGNGSSVTASYTGLRFNNVQIPSGSAIVSAKLQVNSLQDNWISVDMTLSAEASGNSPAFSKDSPPSLRLLTSKQVNHSSGEAWQAATWYDLDEMAPVVQEVVNRADWQSGNSLSIVLKGNGNAWGRKYVHSYSDSPDLAVKLVITYK